MQTKRPLRSQYDMCVGQPSFDYAWHCGGLCNDDDGTLTGTDNKNQSSSAGQFFDTLFHAFPFFPAVHKMKPREENVYFSHLYCILFCLIQFVYLRYLVGINFFRTHFSLMFFVCFEGVLFSLCLSHIRFHPFFCLDAVSSFYFIQFGICSFKLLLLAGSHGNYHH